MKRIAIIPARAGSKGLPDKNIIDICGKPLIAYSIEAALKSNLFERVIVSTDSEHYKEISEAYGAQVMMRTAELASDTATTYMVLENMLNNIDIDFDYFMLLQPTSPMRTSEHVTEACELFEKNMNQYDFMASVKEADHPAVLVRAIEDDMSMKHFDIDYSNYRRQGYKDYSPNGAIYIAKPHSYLEQKHFYGAKSLAYLMNAEDSLDIDGQLDYEIACFFMKKRIEAGRI